VPFRNSWTGKQYTPTFISISHNFTSELKGDAWRAETLFRFDIGAPIEDEPSFKPGEIRCYQCAISIPRGVINEFFVRIADMDGTLIKGNQRGRYYFRGWEDGHKLKPQPVRPYTEGFSLRPRIVWIIPSNMNQTLAWLIHYGGSLTFFGQAGLCLILATLVRKKRLLRAFMYTASAVACLIAIAYVVSPMMP
jgi:hypothetical protein